LTVDGPQTRRYVLQAWRDGARSPLSPARTVRPHAPATVTSVEYPASNSVRLTFTEPLRRPLRPDQFRLAADGLSPRRLVQPDNARAVVLRFDAAVAGRSGELRWSPLADASGLAVGQTAVPITFPASGQGGLIVRQAEIRPKGRVQLEFSAPLDPARATDPSRYDVRPVGRVVAVEQPGTPSAQVTLRIEGVSIGPSGQETSLRLSGLQSTGGARLSEQSTTVRLTTPAGDLSNAYVYPNPYRARSHEQMTVAGLPREATVRIFTPDGRLVRVLSVEDNRTGGTTWDVRDRRGDPVPSGVYLFRINAPDDDPVLEKAAVIR
jgi:hypothetical protein